MDYLIHQLMNSLAQIQLNELIFSNLPNLKLTATKINIINNSTKIKRSKKIDWTKLKKKGKKDHTHRQGVRM